MNLRLLKVFKTNADSGGMAAAEPELNVGISTVNRHVKDLETRLGPTLLCRRGRAGFSLTAEGDLREAGAVVGRGQQLPREHQRRSWPHGRNTLELGWSTRPSPIRVAHQYRVRISTAFAHQYRVRASVPRSRMSAAIGEFLRAACDVSLNAHVSSINNIERGLMAGSFHAGVIPAHTSSKSLIYEPVLFGINAALLQRWSSAVQACGRA